MNSVETVQQSKKIAEMFGPFLGDMNINIGCGNNRISGFLNIDEDEWCLGESEPPYSVTSIKADCIIASHVMEHVRNIIPAMRDIHRVLKPGGHFIAITPYASSDDAWEDPTHVRCFTERSWYYFNRKLYETPGHAGHYNSPVDFDFDVVQVQLVPYEEFRDDQDIEFKKKHWRNVIRECQAVLRKA